MERVSCKQVSKAQQGDRQVHIGAQRTAGFGSIVHPVVAAKADAAKPVVDIQIMIREGFRITYPLHADKGGFT